MKKQGPEDTDAAPNKILIDLEQQQQDMRWLSDRVAQQGAGPGRFSGCRPSPPAPSSQLAGPSSGNSTEERGHAAGTLHPPATAAAGGLRRLAWTPLLFALLVLVVTGLSVADAYFNMRCPPTVH